jgi:hypothetical protein
MDPYSGQVPQDTEGKVSEQETAGAKGPFRDTAPEPQTNHISGDVTETSVQKHGGHKAPGLTVKSQCAEIAAPGHPEATCPIFIQRCRVCTRRRRQNVPHYAKEDVKIDNDQNSRSGDVD